VKIRSICDSRTLGSRLGADQLCPAASLAAGGQREIKPCRGDVESWDRLAILGIRVQHLIP
jgi:hypothetical protein